MDKIEQAKIEILDIQGESKVRFRPGRELVMEVYTDQAGYMALVERIERLGLKPTLVGSKPLVGGARRFEAAVDVPDGWKPPNGG